ncbi:FAD dependent oxidoreductase [Deinococcus proteolyticus MRP]|uniref:FAD dependent oxidoreductase n=1 Tax=Deinococcus proteolyticus (strain ATCC 35074 / DSM 20540 / JCM 6276 / NBRC 101906 / NCIMB 13154 / VKM Ac-1939 / CCM 2703 / MRP) TaxID=693977 RepID=F0RKY0_DEIPM|nr:FAD-dependent oxidoreductase [Deinococcus proteolyticus]ADY25753.1 FAD dependent oxidoreductase [Deinococcus proteolyticus MRP]
MQEATRSSERGQVWAHVGQAFKEQEYDVAVVGAGLLGTAAALYLRGLWPQRRVLLLDEGGLPSEDGATLLGAGVWDAAGLSGAEADLAATTRRELERLLPGGLTPLPLLDFGAQGPEDTAELLADFPALAGWVDPAALPRAERREVLTYRPGELTLRLGQAAVAAGADLLLNTRAELVPGGVRLHRLTVTNRHEIVVHETREVRAGTVIVAAGAAGPELLEQGLGLHTPHGRAFVQRPRLRQPSDPAASPLLRAGDLLLRPLNGEYALYLPPVSADPHGYQPTAGRLTGVQVGLRRELLCSLLPRMDALPVLATAALGVGRSLADVEGAWLGLPHGGPTHAPLAEAVADGVWLLLGGSRTRGGVDTLGLGLVRELVGTLN